MKVRLFLTFLVAFLFVPAVIAVESNMIMPIEPPNQPNFLGQDHSYSVTFRGNGESVITLKSIFSNLSTETMTAMTFKVPKISPQDIVAYQVIREGQCIQYEPTTEKTLTPVCATFQEPDYYTYYYGSTTYLKAQTVLNGDTIEVTVPKPILANKSGSIILYYRGVGYTAKTITGAYSFSFETAKVADKIRSLQVGINTDSDLVLKGAQSQVNYEAPMQSEKLLAMDRSVGAGVNSSQFDAFYQQIGQGSIIKTASNLQPMESYTVTGAYGTSSFQIYAKEISLAILIPIILILLVGFPIVRAIKRTKTENNSQMSGSNILLGVGVGLLTAVILCVHTALFFSLMSFIQNNYMYGQFSMFLPLALFIIAASIYVVLFTVPSIIVGVKRGLWAGVITAISIVVWLIVGLTFIIGATYLFGTINGRFPQQQIPMMRSSDVNIQEAAPAGTTEQMELKN